MTLTIRIPMCPPMELSPNARLGWQARHEAKCAYRDCAYLATRSEAHWCDAWFPGEDGPIPYRVTIGWGKGRKTMDPDNAVAALKAAIDGVARALGIDDKRMVASGPVRQVRDIGGEGYTEFVLGSPESTETNDSEMPVAGGG